MKKEEIYLKNKKIYGKAERIGMNSLVKNCKLNQGMSNFLLHSHLF